MCGRQNFRQLACAFGLRRPKQCGSKAHSAVFKGLMVRFKDPLRGGSCVFALFRNQSLLAPERRRVCDRLSRQAYTEAESGWGYIFYMLT